MNEQKYQIIEMMSGDQKILVCIDVVNSKVYLQFEEGKQLVNDLKETPPFIINYQGIYFLDIDYDGISTQPNIQRADVKKAFQKLKADALTFIQN